MRATDLPQGQVGFNVRRKHTCFDAIFTLKNRLRGRDISRVTSLLKNPRFLTIFLHGRNTSPPDPSFQFESCLQYRYKISPLQEWAYFVYAAGQGLEPRYHAPEACVLPLDDPAFK